MAELEDLKGRDYIAPELEWTREEYDLLLDLAFDFKKRAARGERPELLRNKTLFQILYTGTLRTRTGLAAAMTQMGGNSEQVPPGGHGEEKVKDMIRCLNTYGDAIASRVFGEQFGFHYGKGNQLIREMARWADIPVINMECDMFHPHEPLEELMTIKDRIGTYKNLKVVYSWAYSPAVWKPVAIPQSLILAWTKYGMEVTLAHPKGFTMDPKILDECKKNADRYGGSFDITNDMDEAVQGADVVHAKAFHSLNLCPPQVPTFDEEKVKESFSKNKDWIMDQRRLDMMSKRGIYLHCLPVDRGYEATDEVIDGPRSAVWTNQEERIHAKKAILVSVMGITP
ncbi:ornithine carbamoyltransferase [[Eubacterium] cellulosolvens]